MMARLLAWFERHVPWVTDTNNDQYLAEMAQYQKRAEIGAIKAEVQKETFLDSMFQQDQPTSPTRPRLPAKSQ